jgi:MFS superfamily sulfate permease-like transporter
MSHTDPNWPTYFFVLLMCTIIGWAWTHRAPPKWWWIVAALVFSIATWACRTADPWFRVGAESELKIVNNSRDTVMAIVVAPQMNRQYIFGVILPGDSATHVLHIVDTPIYVNINGTSYKLQHTDEPMDYRVVVNKP